MDPVNSEVSVAHIMTKSAIFLLKSNNIQRYDGPDVTPFIYTLMCVKQEKLV